MRRIHKRSKIQEFSERLPKMGISTQSGRRNKRTGCVAQRVTVRGPWLDEGLELRGCWEELSLSREI